jgi:hypothetical protein
VALVLALTVRPGAALGNTGGGRVTGPRNARSVARAQRQRAEIRRVWLELVQLQPFERHTHKDIAKHLPFRLSRSTIYWHMQRIRLEAELEAMTATGALDSVRCIP